jgi:signal recognition particle subunit SRP54
LYDSKEAKKNQQKLVDGSFNLEDFQKQFKQFNKIGSMEKMIQMLPVKGIKKMGNVDEKQMVWMNAIINSMTIYERRNPTIINGSRRKRVALGSGRSIFEVNQLLKQFFQIKTMMKKINKKGIFPFNFK